MFATYSFVNSTAIALVAYNSELQTMRVIFQSGLGWDYSGVPASVYVALIQAHSVGRYYGQNVRGSFLAERLEPSVVGRYLLDVIALERNNRLLRLN